MSISRILLPGAVLLLAASCTGYLTVQPQGEVIPSTDEEFSAVLQYHLNEIEGGGDEYILGNMETIARLEGCADDLDANIQVGSNLPAYAGEVINQRMTDYRESFAIIKDCNILIENLRERETPRARGTLSAAYAIKGILYYNLLRDFCEPWGDGSEAGLPIVDRFDITERPARASLRETVEYADAQLRAALALEPRDPEYIFTEYLVKAFRARLAFWAEDWDACAALCRDILDNSGLRLSTRDEYEAMISSAAVKGEILAKSHINNASELDWYFSYVRGYIASRPASTALISLFGEEPARDIRYTTGFNARRFNTKLPERRVRLSEIVLMLAECYAHSGDTERTLLQLNALRRNRILDAEDLSEMTLPPVRTTDKIRTDATGKPLTPLMQAVLDERRRELYMEGDRFYELKRGGRPEWWVISNGLKYTTKAYLYTAPLYKGDLELNPELIQNPGYED